MARILQRFSYKVCFTLLPKILPIESSVPMLGNSTIFNHTRTSLLCFDDMKYWSICFIFRDQQERFLRRIDSTTIALSILDEIIESAVEGKHESILIFDRAPSVYRKDDKQTELYTAGEYVDGEVKPDNIPTDPTINNSTSLPREMSEELNEIFMASKLSSPNDHFRDEEQALRSTSDKFHGTACEPDSHDSLTSTQNSHAAVYKKPEDPNEQAKILLLLYRLACSMVKIGDNICFTYASVLPKVFEPTYLPDLPTDLPVSLFSGFVQKKSSVPWKVDKKILAARLLTLCVDSVNSETSSAFQICAIMVPKLVANLQRHDSTDEEKLSSLLGN